VTARDRHVKEAAKNNWHEGMLIAREWLLIEYAVGTIPVNSETVVEIVSNTIRRRAGSLHHAGRARKSAGGKKNGREALFLQE
jgi:hypothetical protein